MIIMLSSSLSPVSTVRAHEFCTVSRYMFNHFLHFCRKVSRVFRMSETFF